MAAKVGSARAAAELVQPRDRVAFGGLGSEPRTVVNEIARRSEDLPGLTLIAGFLISDCGFLGHLVGSARFQTWFAPSSLPPAAASHIDYLPLSWAQAVALLIDSPVDVAVVQVGPADSRGRHSLGISVSYNRPLVDTARLVIAEVNQRMPYTSHDALIDGSEIDYLVPVDEPLLPFLARPPDAIDRAIAALIADRVPDGATVQPGIGTIPDLVLHGLLARRTRGLRIVSVVTEGVRVLAEADAIASIVAGEVLGEERLYEWVGGNRVVEMRDARTTHSDAYLGELAPLFAINGARQIDLFGQANVEWTDRQSGGVGGSLDFALGTRQSGTYVLALRSTDRTGRTSRIVPKLDGVVSIPRSLVHLVATEYGIADLRNRTAAERALELITIAHPDHRAWLQEAMR